MHRAAPGTAPGSANIIRMSSRAGFSLLEVMVASALAALLLTVLLSLSGVIYRVGHEEIQRSSSEARVLVTCRKLELDLLDSAPPGISISSGGARAVIHPVDAVSSGRVLFADKFLYWTWSATQKRLVRAELDSPPSGVAFNGAAFRWNPAQLGGLPEDGGSRPSWIFESVSKFSLSNPPDVTLPQVGSPIFFELEVEIPIARSRKTFSLKGSVQVRTGGA